MTGAMPASPRAPLFPGGTSLSHLRVYDWPAPDGAGLAGGGTPHLHTASSEGYVVLAGAGSVQTLGPHGFAETVLVPGAVVWFTPGVVHRLVNDGGLEILVVMSNAGLPEAGDAVLTFPADVLADAGRYREAAALPTPQRRPGAQDADDDVVAEAARTRRDLALEGFATLRARVEHEGRSGLDDLYAAAGRLVADRVPRWQKIWAAGVLAQTTATAHALADLAEGNAPHLAQAAVGSTTARPGPRRYGMCGRLTSYL
jgi:mannose-6-phosphate isomerase-like protein (cupin superfamily)